MSRLIGSFIFRFSRNIENSLADKSSVKNFDEEKYPDDHRASFRKTLGLTGNSAEFYPSSTEYTNYVKACNTGIFDSKIVKAKLVDPAAANYWEMYSTDNSAISNTIVPPAFGSVHFDLNILELYAMSLARDIPFSEWQTSDVISKIYVEYKDFSEQFPNYFGQGLFEGNLVGESIGPYISQFLYSDIISGCMTTSQKIKILTPGQNYISDINTYNKIHNGVKPDNVANKFLPNPRYIITLRDLASYVYTDYPCMAFSNAALILLSNFPTKLVTYKNKPFVGFIGLGLPFVLDLVYRATNLALRAAWFHKWKVHRVLRPEEYAYELNKNPTDLIKGSVIVSTATADSGNILLPQGYPEGCPTHPSFPSGHGTIAGACVTVLKALFLDDLFINPQIPTNDGSSLLPYTGQDAIDLKIHGELNKLAANIGAGRSAAGIHYRFDNEEGVLLGEKVAIALLREAKEQLRTSDVTFTFTSFLGKNITI